MSETFPIGVALDLSSKEKVYKPIPTDEIEQSPGPLPGLWVLNNEGVLASWWVVYNESIRTGTVYPGIATGEGAAQPASASTPSHTAFASPAASAASPFGTPAAATPAFGGALTLGAKSSPWATTPAASTAPAFGSSAFGSKPVAAPAFGTPSAAPAFGTPSFGKPAAPAFGQSSLIGLGAKASPWSSASPTAAAPSFGQSGFASSGPATGKVFGSTAASSPSSSGFANFASKGGFGSLAGGSSGVTNIFSKPTGTGAFASSTPEVSMDAETAFPPPAAKKETTPAFGSSTFVLGTTFKVDPKAAEDDEKPKAASGSSMFGNGFGLSLNDAAKQPPAPNNKDEDMDSTPIPTPAPAPVQEKPKSVFSLESTTPTTTPAPQRFDFKPTSDPSTGTNIFGMKPAAPSSGISNIFGTPKPAPADGKPNPFASIFGAPKIKQEDEDKENLANIPEAPLPPDTTSKAVFPFGESSSSSGSSSSPQTASKTPLKSSNAPLPPDSLSKSPAIKTEELTPPPEKAPESKSESTIEAVPLPPDFIFKKPKAEVRTSKSPIPSDAPLPPDFVAKPLIQQLPAVPAVPGSPEEDELSEEGEDQDEDEDEDQEEDEQDDDQEGESGSEANSEGSGVDVAKDLSPTTGFGGSQTPGFTPQSSFGKMAESGYSAISRSEAEQPRALFGEISRNAPPLFPKPVPQSPRSPSPVRSALRGNLLRPSEPMRSVSAPGVASHLLGRKTPQPPSNLGYSIPQRSTPPVDPNVEAQRKLAAAKREAEERVLVDPEDEGIQKILQSEIEPTLHINEFLAVDSKLEPVDTSAREEVPMACEKLWRDINRMIDRLGLNSRSLQSFIRGHSTEFKEGGRHKEDLASIDDWVLVEAEELGLVVETELTQDLEEGRLKDIEQVEASIHHLSRDLAKLRAKEEDMRKIIMSQVNPDQVAVTKSLPLSAEQAAQQNELRRAYATFSKLLAEAEEALTMLKAKIASAGGASGKAPVPTVEAIIRTINKMTSMAEKRSGDIDVLENQMRRLRFGSMGLNGSPGPNRSREGSPYGASTPQKKVSIFSPERMRDSVMSSPGSYGMRGTPPRKKMSMYSEEEKNTVRQKEAKRKSALRLLKASLEKSGPNVSRLRDDD